MPDGGTRAYPRSAWAATVPAGGAFPEPARARAVAAGVHPDEPVEVHVPLVAWLADRGADSRPAGRPLVVGITGSVAAGKSTLAAVVADAWRARPDRPRVAVVGTDSFLLPGNELAARGLVTRKGFPESYDDRRLDGAVAAIRQGDGPVRVPVYSHQAYDIVAGAEATVAPADVVLLEGLALPGPAEGLARCDLLVYLDADEADLRRWFTERLVGLSRSAPPGGDDLYSRLGTLPPDQLGEVARWTWEEINLVNLRRHILPARAVADVVLEQGPDHRVDRVVVREG